MAAIKTAKVFNTILTNPHSDLRSACKMSSVQYQVYHFVTEPLSLNQIMIYNSYMENFRNVLQQEYLKRVRKNPQYSLRAFAQYLDVNHAILSMVLSGKRKITKAMVTKFSKTLGLTPAEVDKFLNSKITEAEKTFFLLQNDVFSFISEWHYDAILELTLVPGVKIEPRSVARILDLPVVRVTLALETLMRLKLLRLNESGRYEMTYKNSTNILDYDATTSAQKNYQKSVLEKSLQAIETIDRKKRDHSSTIMAICTRDLPAAKELIKKFRHDLNAFMQKDESSFNDIHQLQIAFFPLTDLNNRNLYEN